MTTPSTETVTVVTPKRGPRQSESTVAPTVPVGTVGAAGDFDPHADAQTTTKKTSGMILILLWLALYRQHASTTLDPLAIGGMAVTAIVFACGVSPKP